MDAAVMSPPQVRTHAGATYFKAFCRLSPLRIAVVECDLTPGLGWWVARVLVPVGHRGKGIGSLLMHELAAWADEHGHELVLQARPYEGNAWLPGLIRFYERFGFIVEGRSRDDAAMRRPVDPCQKRSHPKDVSAKLSQR